MIQIQMMMEVVLGAVVGDARFEIGDANLIVDAGFGRIEMKMGMKMKRGSWTRGRMATRRSRLEVEVGLGTITAFRACRKSESENRG